ncbi:nucleotidyltransferase family protein [Riemerella columbina]|uniref:nucleotidyltransferase family protein n=1 Tax=Riemerella columbina TaxID=103810 RepID=UPI00037221CE|nr:nucleotidyltransferase domain-containing protein [Riemerella columbina]
MLVQEFQSTTLNDLCRIHKVKDLFVFGSVLTPDFNESSDIDFLVKFQDMDLHQYFDNFLSLKESLEQLFKRKVDLVEQQTLKNPILIQSINQTKQPVYVS